MNASENTAPRPLGYFPTIGNFSRHFSNHWKLSRELFQSLEVFTGVFPIVGNFFQPFSNHWKTTCTALLLLLCAAISTPADEITLRFDFPPETVSLDEADGFTRIALPGGLPPDTPPGAPLIPARYVNILLPEDEQFVSLDVQAQGAVLADNIMVYPAQPPYPLNSTPPVFVTPDPLAYASPAPTPALWAEFIATQEIRGRRFATIRLNPLRYHPADRQLLLAPRIDLTLSLRPARAASQPALTISPLFNQILQNSVVNPDPSRRADLPSINAVPYIIITSESLTNAFLPLAQHRQNIFGTNRTAIVTVEEILAAFPGRDNPEKIRNFIIHAVASNSTDYILLGGDDTIVPARIVGISSDDLSTNTPVDLYYSALLGDWDANANNIFGELADLVDMTPDVIIGRLPVRTPQDTAQYTAKLIAYESGARSDLYGKLLLSGTKGFNMLYGSQRASDPVFDSYPSFLSHQPVSDVEQWSRRIHRDAIQPAWSASELEIFFDTLTSWDESHAGDFDQNPERFIEAYNIGWEHQFYFTHGDWNGYCLEDEEFFDTTHAAQITNLTCFIATPACLTSYFDGPNDPCLAEVFLRSPAGALIYHACSRYGWGSDDNYGGYSSSYIREYYALLLTNSTPSPSFGSAFAQGKTPFIPLSLENNPWRWLQFAVNLLGDPALPARINPLPKPPVLTSIVNTNLPQPAILVEWNDQSPLATAGFDIQRIGGEDDDWRTIASTPAQQTHYTDTNITLNLVYLYRVRATHSFGHSIWSDAGGLITGTLPPDPWDPADDSPASATTLPLLSPSLTNHGPHTLSSTDTNDWFLIPVTNGHALQLSTYAPGNFGGLYARVYDARTNLIAADGDSNGLNRFSFFLTPTNTETWLLQIEPNRDRDSAYYSLYYSHDLYHSSSAELAAALDATQFTWRTSTALLNPWFAQTNHARFGDSAVQAGPISRPLTGSSSYSWLETETPLSSPAFLSFWAQTDLDPGVIFRLLVNGEESASLTDATQWSRQNIPLMQFTNPATIVTMRFEVVCSDADNPILSDAWLDHFELIGPDAIAPLPLHQTASNTLAAGHTQAYSFSTEQPGHAQLTLQSSSIILVIIYSQDGEQILYTHSDYPIRWPCQEPTYYIMLINESAQPITYSATPDFRAISPRPPIDLLLLD